MPVKDVEKEQSGSYTLQIESQKWNLLGKLYRGNEKENQGRGSINIFDWKNES